MSKNEAINFIATKEKCDIKAMMISAHSHFFFRRLHSIFNPFAYKYSEDGEEFNANYTFIHQFNSHAHTDTIHGFKKKMVDLLLITMESTLFFFAIAKI